jgi:type I restriction enzyme, S subunit
MHEEQELPKGWVKVALGELSSPVSTTKPEAKPDTEFVYLDIASIDNKAQRIVSPQKLKGSNAPSRARQVVRSKDILFSTVRTYLKNIAQVEPQYEGQVASTGFCVIRPTAVVEPSYIFYHVLSEGFLQPLGEIQRGSSYPAVRDSDVFDQKILLAPLPEQRRIVAKLEELFSKLDAGVEALRATQKLLKRYRQSVLHAAVTGELTRAWREAHPAAAETGEALLARIRQQRRAQWEETTLAKLRASGKEPKGEAWKQKYQEPEAPDTAELPELPLGWAWASVEQISDLDVGFAFKSEQFTKEGIRLLRGENIEPGALRWKDVRYWPENNVEPFDKYLIKQGQIILAMDRPLISSGLKLARAKSSDLPCLLVQRMARFRPAEEGVNGYLYLFLQTQQAISHLLGGQTGTQLPHISGRGIVSMLLPLPPLVEQYQIVREVERRLSVLDRLEETTSDELTRAERLRQSILHRAFTGQLVPQDPTDEPAVELLARLRAAQSEAAPKKAKTGKPGRKPKTQPEPAAAPVAEVPAPAAEPLGAGVQASFGF